MLAATDQDHDRLVDRLRRLPRARTACDVRCRGGSSRMRRGACRQRHQSGHRSACRRRPWSRSGCTFRPATSSMPARTANSIIMRTRPRSAAPASTATSTLSCGRRTLLPDLAPAAVADLPADDAASWIAHLVGISTDASGPDPPVHHQSLGHRRSVVRRRSGDLAARPLRHHRRRRRTISTAGSPRLSACSGRRSPI